MSTGCGGSDAGSSDPVNVSLDELYDTALSAGLECDSFTEWTDAKVGGGGVIEMGTCNPGSRNVSALTIYADHDAAVSESDRVREDGPEVAYGVTVPETLVGPQILGSNWIISSEQAEDLSPGMDGEFLPPEDGWAEQDQCEDQVMEIVGGMFTDQMGETSGAWQQAAYKYGVEDPAFVMAGPILQKAIPQIPANGLESAWAGAVGEASVKCSEYLAAPESAAAPEAVGDGAAEPSDEVPTCEVAPEFTPDASVCAAAQALLDACDNLEPPLTVASWDRVGITPWEAGADGITDAVTSQDAGTSEPTVLSCGDAGNGVDVLQLHDDVWASAEQGWGIEVTQVTCSASGDGILNTLPPGESVASCAVQGADWDAAASYAFISITGTAPYYRIDLGE